MSLFRKVYGKDQNGNQGSNERNYNTVDIRWYNTVGMVQWRFGTVMYCIGQLMMSHVEDDDVIKQMVEEDSCSRW